MHSSKKSIFSLASKRLTVSLAAIVWAALGSAPALAAPATPILLSPSNGAVLTGTSVTLSWSFVSGAGAYSVGLRDLTTGILANIPLVTATSTTQPTIPGHSYKWDVASCTSAGGGDNPTNCPNRSGDWFFSMQNSAPPAPTLISPSNGAVLNGSTVTLTWSSVSGAGAYSVGLRDQTTGILANIPLVTGTNTNQPIIAGHSYKWDVASCISAGGGDNTTNCPNRSGDWFFSSQASAPPAPSLISPANGSTVAGTTVTLVWSLVSGAGAYSVGLRDQTTGILATIPLVTGTSTTQPIVAGHNYKWDVASCKSAGGGDNPTNCPNRSGDWFFTAQGTTAPPAPNLISPANGSTVAGTTVTLVWSLVSGAGAYSVGLRDQTTGILATIPLVTGTSTTQPIVAGHNYKWDVASCKSAGGGDNPTNCPNRSGDWLFTAQGTTAPPAPNLISPANGAVLAGAQVTLKWSFVSSAGAYKVVLHDITKGIYLQIPLTTATSTVQNVVSGDSYKWDVFSCYSASGGDNPTNCPNRSVIWGFTIQATFTPWIWPIYQETVRNTVSQDYEDFDDGYFFRTTGKHHYYFHTGLDIAEALDTKVVAAKDGYIAMMVKNNTDGEDHGDGNTIVISHTGGIFSQYQHLHKFDPALQSQIESQCSPDQKKWVYICGPTTVHVTIGGQIGFVGGSGNGSDTTYGTHLHFEVKNFPDLKSPKDTDDDKGWGYTKDMPGDILWPTLGYYDPSYFLEGATPVGPMPVSIVKPDGVNLRLGPKGSKLGYPVALVLPAGATSLWARQSAPATDNCSRGWYEVYLSNDGSYPPIKNTNYFHSTLLSDVANLPGGWVCRGDDSGEWVTSP